MKLEGRFAEALADILHDPPPRRIGLAVSGGGDSMALLHLARGWAAERAVTLSAATVDHGLRSEAAEEARMVAGESAALGLEHATLRWTGWDGRGNLQAAARRARGELMEEWASTLSLDAILTGHTMDDQAETVLMRLARGSGVDGLAGMPPVRPGRPTWARPLLGFRRAELRAWLQACGITWLEDPSNEDQRFDRVRARRTLEPLSDLGLTVERLERTARHMRHAREVLDAAAQDLANRAVTVEEGDLLIRLEPFRGAAAETRTRLLSAALQWVSGAPYRPRYTAIERLSAEPAGMLHGCLVSQEAGAVRITRELAAVRDLRCATQAEWDGRWRLEGAHAPELTVAALTVEGLSQCPGWRDARLPASSLQATPAVWRGEDLVAAPLAGRGDGWTARLADGRDVFSMLPIMR